MQVEPEDVDMEEEQEDQEDQKEPDASEDSVQTKYRVAGDIANRALALVISKCAPGASVFELTDAGDAFIRAEVANVYKTCKDRGIAFPTCVSVNHIVGHYSPLPEEKTVLAAGDMAKIDLGVQIDGFIAVAAHTVVVGGAASGQQANVMAAAYSAAEIALRKLTVGAKNGAVTEMFSEVAGAYKVNVCQGVLSHRMKHFVIDGNDVIISRSDVDQKVDDYEFKPFDVFAIDVVMSTGEGKPREVESRATVFKRVLDQNYMLKIRASRAVLAEVSSRFPVFPFHLRWLDAKNCKFGILECVKHDLLQAFPVLQEKEGDFVAHFKFTVLVTPNGPVRLAGLPLDMSQLHCDADCKLPEPLTAVMASSASKKANKKKKKKATASSSASSSAAAVQDEEDMPAAADS